MIDAMEAESDITDVMGGAIYFIGPFGQDRNLEVPSLTLMLGPDSQDELFEDILFQIDIWTRTLQQAIDIERVVRWLFHHDVETEIQGVKMFIQFAGGRTVEGPGKDNYFGRSLDFVAMPIRSKYLRAAES